MFDVIVVALLGVQANVVHIETRSGLNSERLMKVVRCPEKSDFSSGMKDWQDLASCQQHILLVLCDWSLTSISLQTSQILDLKSATDSSKRHK